MDKKFLDLTLLMEREPAAMAEHMKEMLKGLNADDADLSDGPVQYFFHEVIGVVLEWMGKGEIKKIDGLLGRMHNVIYAESHDPYVMDGLSPNEQLTADLTVLCHILAIYLRTNNLAKLLAILSNPRFKKHRNIIRWMYKNDKRVSAKEITLYPKSTSYRLLSQLTKMGFLEKEQVGRNVAYDLSWAGRNVGKMYVDIYAGDVTDGRPKKS